MKRVLLVLVALVLLAPTAFADVTVTTSISILAAAMTADGTMTTYAKGTKFLRRHATWPARTCPC